MRICDAVTAAAMVPDGATVLIEGSGGGVNEATAILGALEERFLAEAHPKDLTLVHISGMGDGHGGGMDHFAHPGLVRRVIGGHWGWTQRMQEMAITSQIEAYCLPQGTLSHLMRDIAGGRPGAISAVGLGTCVDPRHGGGKLNDATTEDLVHVIELQGREWLFTPAFPIDVAVIRGTRADTLGNLTMDGEGLQMEALSVAQAARNSGGIVIAQVRELVEAHDIDPRRVRVPGVLIDALVVDPEQRLSFATRDDPYMTGEARAPETTVRQMPLTVRKVIARRAALELRDRDIINLGFGMPDGVAAVLAEERQADRVTFTVEQGHIGGVPVGGSDFGMCVNPEASVGMDHQFDWYDGGGLDIAVLSFAQLDRVGNVNVGKFSGRIPGVGGFINISQGAKRIVFVGTLVAGGKGYTVGGERAITVPEGGESKLVEDVEQISFSAARAVEVGQRVLYVTERAVFELTPEGIELIELAPGLDLTADLLDHMEFKPLVSADVREMDPRIFAAPLLGLDLATAGRSDDHEQLA